jgi:hypothetical protein
MRRIASPKHEKWNNIAVTVAISIFLIQYVGSAIHSASMRYATAMNIAKNRAHTRVGIEGYEYIFEPNTQIFVDKILPNGTKIIVYIVLQDYLPFKIFSRCWFLDQDVCKWIEFNIFYTHDPTPTIRKITLYASITALTIGVGFYLFTKRFIYSK